MNAVLYSQPTCVPCRFIIKKFDDNEVPLEVINVQENPAAADRVVELGYTGTPVVEYTDADGQRQHFKGLQVDLINEICETAKSSIPA